MRPGPLLAPHPERPLLVISHTRLAPGPWLGGAKGSEALRGWIWTAFRLIPEARNHVGKQKNLTGSLDKLAEGSHLLTGPPDQPRTLDTLTGAGPPLGL